MSDQEAKTKTKEVITCPRRLELLQPLGEPQDYWREDNTCSYCGSLHPDTFMELIAAGVAVIPTDKRYKAYIKRPNARVGKRKIVGIASSNHIPLGDEWIKADAELLASLALEGALKGFRIEPGEYLMLGTEGINEEVKFYFQHLDRQQEANFISMYNDKSMMVDYPGYFYTLPYFCKTKGK